MTTSLESIIAIGCIRTIIMNNNATRMVQPRQNKRILSSEWRVIQEDLCML